MSDVTPNFTGWHSDPRARGSPATVPSTFAALAGLPVVVDGYELAPLSLYLTPRFTRHTTVVRLFGAGQESTGEDTTYAAPDQLAFQSAAPVLPLGGRWSIDSFSAHLERLELFPTGPSREAARPPP